MTNFSISRYKGEKIELSAESYEQQSDESRKRSRRREESRAVDDMNTESTMGDACSEVWCPLSENPCSSRGVSNDDFSTCGPIFSPEESFGQGSELYTQLLLGSDLALGFECKDSTLPWNSSVHKDRRFMESSCCLGMPSFSASQSILRPCDGTSQVDVRHPLAPEMGAVQKQESVENGGLTAKESGERKHSECFSQDAWTGIMEGIPGSELAYLMAGGMLAPVASVELKDGNWFVDWLQDSKTAFDDILNNDN